MLKRVMCDHEYETTTNIHGEMINHMKCRSIQKCMKCGKKKYLQELDKNCDISNETD